MEWINTDTDVRPLQNAPYNLDIRYKILVLNTPPPSSPKQAISAVYERQDVRPDVYCNETWERPHGRIPRGGTYGIPATAPSEGENQLLINATSQQQVLKWR